MENRIKNIRQQANLTQMELSRKSGVSRGTIALLESNTKKSVSTKTLLKLSNALGVSINQIFFD